MNEDHYYHSASKEEESDKKDVRNHLEIDSDEGFGVVRTTTVLETLKDGRAFLIGTVKRVKIPRGDGIEDGLKVRQTLIEGVSSFEAKVAKEAVSVNYPTKGTDPGANIDRIVNVAVTDNDIGIAAKTGIPNDIELLTANTYFEEQKVRNSEKEDPGKGSEAKREPLKRATIICNKAYETTDLYPNPSVDIRKDEDVLVYEDTIKEAIQDEEDPDNDDAYFVRIGNTITGEEPDDHTDTISNPVVEIRIPDSV